MNEIILINISGEDKPGLTSSLTSILSSYGVNILDIGQAVIHETLSLGMVVEVPANSASVFRDLLFKAHQLGVHVRFTPISEDRYEKWVSGQGRQRYIVTLLGRRLSAEQIARLTSTIAAHGLNIDKIARLSGRVSLTASSVNTPACVEFSVRGIPKDIESMRAEFMRIASDLDVDIGFQLDNVYRRNRRLVAFDMDATLIQVEVIDELAKAAGAGAAVARITDAAMRGELDFTESFRSRLCLLKGLEEARLEEIAERIPLTDGAERLIGTLRKLGYKTAILSGGFTYFGRRLQKQLGIDYLHANELEIRNGRVTGEVVGEIVDGRRKALLLREIAAKENFSLEQVIAVGDGANDLPMLNIAGLGIAFHAKPVVRESARHSISNLGLDGILYLIGLRDRETVV
jgi:phosphoserine phosphatase